MRTILVHQPQSASFDVAEIKQFVSERNVAILLGNEFPATAPFLSVRDLIGDPNYAFSDTVAAILAESGILVRSPVKTRKAQDKITVNEKKELVWEYVWGDKPFDVLTKEQLLLVGWDLRKHNNFVHVSIVSDETQEENENVLDSSQEEEEYDDVDFEE